MKCIQDSQSMKQQARFQIKTTKKMVKFYDQYKDTLDDSTRSTIEFILENNYDYAEQASGGN